MVYLVILLALVSSELVGCAAGANLQAEQANLVIAIPKGNDAQALQGAAAVYTAQSGKSVRVEALGTDAYADQVAAVLLSGQPRYDLVYLPADSLARWAAYQAIRPAPDGLDTRPLEPWLPALTFQGRLYGLPVNPDPLVMWYRADLLAQKPPALSDWHSVALAAAAIANAKPAGFYPIAFAGSELDGGRDFAAVLTGMGGQIVTDSYQVDVDSAAAQQALKSLVSMVRMSQAAPETARMTQADVVNALAQGKAGLGLAPLSAGQRLLDCQASPKVCQDGHPLLDWTGLPGLAPVAAQGDLSAWALPLHARHPQAAEAFAAWLASEPGARAWAQNGGIPAHLGVLSALPAPAEGKTASLTSRGASALAGLKTYRLAFPPAPNAELLWQAINPLLHSALTGEQPPEQILSGAREAIQKALRQDGLLP